MKYKLALLGVCFITIFAACNKNPAFTGPKLMVADDMRSNTYSKYSYNDDGTVNKIQGVGDTFFSYMGDTVFESFYSSSGIPTGGYFFVKNSDGQADTAQGTAQNQNYYFSYNYDPYSMFVSEKIYLWNGTARALQQTMNYTNSGKNIYEMITIASNGNQTYDYYNFFSSNSNSIGVQDQGKYYLGASPTSPVEKDININSNLDTVYTINYRYAYDGSGRIDTMVSYKIIQGALNNTGTLLDSIAFSYYN